MHKPFSFLSPLDKVQRSRCEQLPRAHVFQLFRVAQTVEIPVKDAHPVDFVGFDEGIGGTFDTHARIERLNHAPGKKRLARPQIAFQPDDHGLLPLAHPLPQRVHPAPGESARLRFRMTDRRFQQDKMRFMHGHDLKQQLKEFARTLGFADLGVTDTDLSAYEADYFNWLGRHFHGEMDYMARHGLKRTRPNLLVPGTVRIISLRMPYYSPDAADPVAQLNRPEHAYVSRYALNRDYHKLIRKRLKRLVAFIEERVGTGFNYRIFTDSAPVLERPIAEKAGLGFIGKNSLVIHPRAGSWFFLAEIFTDLELPVDPPFEKQGCGPCTACIAECPTGAIVAPGVVDARRCISYLTIEHPGEIPEALRPLMGNRIYGCDDCQLVCPWNRFAECSKDESWQPRHRLDRATLLELWMWTEEDFLKNLEGSPIRRIGYERWLRNLAVALGNGPWSEDVEAALRQKRPETSEMVQKHIDWALDRLRERRDLPKMGETPFPRQVRKAHLPRCDWERED